MSTIVGLCTLELQVPASSSLKDKRRVVRSVRDRLRSKFNVSVAEVGELDSWQFATIALVCVSNDRGYADGLLQRAARFVEDGRFDLVLLDYQIEMI